MDADRELIELAVDQSLRDAVRQVGRAAVAIFDREQKADVVQGIIATLTQRALDATERAGKAEGYNQKLQEELKRQLAVQERFATLVAWYELKTHIVVGGHLSTDRYDRGPHAEGIRCERCHRQIEDHQIEEHFAMHIHEDEIERRAEQMRREEAMRPPVMPKRRAPRKPKVVTPTA